MSEKKNCNKCGELKPFTEFYKNKTFKDGLQYECKECQKLQNTAHRRTKKGVAITIYSTQRRLSKDRGHAMPNYTFKQLLEWLNQQVNFDCLYLNWINSGYSKMKKPSCDRLDDYAPYSLDNIRLVTWEENNQKGNIDRKNGVNNKASKAVRQLTLDGELVKEYHSVRQAERDTGLDHGSISNCCNGKGNHAGGYQWVFAMNNNTDTSTTLVKI